VVPVVPVMPAVPAPVRMRPVIAIGAVPVWTMPAAAPGVAHPAHLLDLRRLTRDLARLRQSIRHCGSRSCRERHAAECSQTNNNSFHGHGFLLLRNPELPRDQLVATTSARGARFNLGEHSFSLDEVIFARAQSVRLSSKAKSVLTCSGPHVTWASKAWCRSGLIARIVPDGRRDWVKVKNRNHPTMYREF
jgi:hypothetical protein